MNRDRARYVAGSLLLLVATAGAVYFGIVVGSLFAAGLCVTVGVVGTGQLLDDLRVYLLGLVGVALFALLFGVGYYVTDGVTALTTVLLILAAISFAQGVRAYRALD
ncbi:hypothetical protein SAMN04487950_1629 [Halogranum rubrum]|uniref:Uncharacterized protein n=2 Tax=Halogranum rubrum TaxID=553466 RepID=A0A1I4D5M0_9EURY|nr:MULTISPECIES: hypothetical protein [Halogranum]EJN58870.1 hypothetical protein HSB1_22910 [Halogranum salarium B-1]SFK88435.1 hypothetical protein SAMN04487950_1629 [Halogranum rubrum]